MGELDKFIDGAIAKLDGILKSCADLADKIIDNLVDVMRRVLGQKDLFTVGTPASPETKVHDPKTQSTWNRMWGTAVRYTKQSANYVAKAAASQLPDGVASRVNGVIGQMLDFKQQLRGQLSRLADKESQASIMWLLHKLRDALLKRKGQRAAIVAPQAGAKAEKENPGTQLGHINKQAGAQGTAGCKNCPAPARKGASISLATGNESFTHTDFVLAAPLPIEWARTYASDLDAFDHGSLGARWITPYSMRVDITTPARGTRQGQPSLLHHAADGRSHAYPVLAVGQSYFDAIEEVRVSRLSESLLELDFGKPLPEGEQSDWREIYEYVDGKQPHFRLVAQQAKDGMAIGLRYDHVIAETGERVLSDIISKHGEAVMAHVGTKPDAQTGLIQSLWELKDGQVVRQLAAYTHDAQRDLVAAQDEDGASWRYTYSHHLVSRYTDRTGRGMNLEYDGTGPDAKAVREWSDDGSFALKLEWDRNIRLTYVTDALGGETWHYYDIQGYTYRIIHPDGLQEWFFRDDAKNVTRHVHTDGTTDDYTYDADGNLQTHTRADGSRVHYEYDGLHRLTGIRDAEGGVWKRDYDAQGHLTEEIDPLGHKTEYAYDKAGRPVRITDAKGGVKTLAYSASGQLLSYTDCSAKTSRWEYDERGRLTKAADAAGNATGYRYAAGQLEEIVLPDQTSEQFEHDAEGRLLKHTDALGRATRYSYTRAGLIAGRTDAAGRSLKYHWDLLGRLTELQNENGSRYDFRYDPVGRLLEETGFDRKATQYVHEETTGVLAEVIEAGHRTELEFDPLGRLSERRAGGQSERFAYDRNGRLLEATNSDARLQWFYDPAGNLTREHHHYLQRKRTAVWQHRYDELNQRIATVRPDGHVIQWLTYGSGHVHGLMIDGQDVLGFERDDLHREVAREQGNGLSQRQKYDPAGRLLEQQISRTSPGAIESTTGIQRRYSYDKAGQLIGIGDSRRGNLSYRYDPVGRLLEANSRVGRETFAFDPAGNIVDPPATNDPLRHPANKLLDNLLKNYAGTSYRYDERGNMTERVRHGWRTVFAWDGFNRMTAATDQRGITTSFSYDALGRRLSKSSGETTTLFGWDGDVLAFESTQSKSAMEEGGEHGWSVHYIHEANSFVPLVQVRQARAMALSETTDAKALMEANGGVYDIEQDPLWNGEQRQVPRAFDRREMAFYQCDHLGTPQELTDHEGSIAWSAQYKAWGEAREAISEAGRRAGFRNPIRFQGQYWDEETGLHYNRYRYYEPSLGRFLSRDLMGLLGGINTHAYSLNPTEWVDPLGLSAKKPQCPINGAAIYAEKRARIEALIAQHDYADAGHTNSNPQIPGGVSGAIVNERTTGLPTGGKWHTQKGSDILGRLKKELRSVDNSYDMSDCDKRKLHDLADPYVGRLQHALSTPMKTP
ncbi:RHS repeat-associated core domain-containing protein [Variovorax sp. efr-133-TYG-130]|uniref:RHS repeat-associated core domain-containing protein n=1 Tax=Variovorax sp. efr-133-TYG-130 TaxID=3040327 RepID=UPI0025531117|nr:RHS repeat-associated core domain-containing protein [Variovorax sp. efr-133-TYG-130]